MLLRLTASEVKSTITNEPRFAVMYNTWRIRGAPVGRHLVGFGSVDNFFPTSVITTADRLQNCTGLIHTVTVFWRHIHFRFYFPHYFCFLALCVGLNSLLTEEDACEQLA